MAGRARNTGRYVGWVGFVASRAEIPGYVESFNARFLDELLNGELFCTLREAQVIIESWRRECNEVRPHSSLGYRPPAPAVIRPVAIPMDSDREEV